MRWIHALPPLGSKQDRASQKTPKFERGEILIPREAPWLRAFEDAPENLNEVADLQDLVVSLNVPTSIVRSGKRVRLAIKPEGSASVSLKDPALIKLVAKAWTAREALEASEKPMADVAREAGHKTEYFSRLAHLGYLAPDIITAILEGRQPATLTRQRLARLGNLPLDWERQRQTLGFV